MKRAELPALITRGTAEALHAAFAAAIPVGFMGRRPRWLDLPVVLEFGVGELLDAEKKLALLGRARPELVKLDAAKRSAWEGLKVQGVEGIVRVERPLFEAVCALELCEDMRARVRVKGGRKVTIPAQERDSDEFDTKDID